VASGDDAVKAMRRCLKVIKPYPSIHFRSARRNVQPSIEILLVMCVKLTKSHRPGNPCERVASA
jgi:hypothetical protein